MLCSNTSISKLKLFMLYFLSVGAGRAKLDFFLYLEKKRCSLFFKKNYYKKNLNKKGGGGVNKLFWEFFGLVSNFCK